MGCAAVRELSLREHKPQWPPEPEEVEVSLGITRCQTGVWPPFWEAPRVIVPKDRECKLLWPPAPGDQEASLRRQPHERQTQGQHRQRDFARKGTWEHQDGALQSALRGVPSGPRRVGGGMPAPLAEASV